MIDDVLDTIGVWFGALRKKWHTLRGHTVQSAPFRNGHKWLVHYCKDCRRNWWVHPIDCRCCKQGITEW